MAKAVALVSAALCMLAIATVAHSHETFKVEGDVYCDPCRVQFFSKFSQKISGAAVKLECLNIDTNAVTLTVEGTTDANGHYVIPVEGEHQNEICEVKVVNSPRPDCNEPMPDFVKSQIECTVNSGINSNVRHANPIGFMTKNVLPACTEILQELVPADDVDLLN